MITVKDLFLNRKWIIENVDRASRIIRPHLKKALEIHNTTGEKEVEVEFYLFTFLE